jgi:hypothetical protein
MFLDFDWARDSPGKLSGHDLGGVLTSCQACVALGVGSKPTRCTARYVILIWTRGVGVNPVIILTWNDARATLLVSS